MKHAPQSATLLSCLFLSFLAAPAWADDASPLKGDAVIDLLQKQTGVYDRSTSGKTPEFVVDPTWPQPLPHSWRSEEHTSELQSQ